MLNFDDVQEITNVALNEKNNKRKIEPKGKTCLSSEEDKQVDDLIKDIDSQIINLALKGYNNLLYDCSKTSIPLFFETGKRFKILNPRFYVEHNFGTQIILISWSGKNEC